MQALRHLRGSKEVDYFDTNRVRPAEIRPEGRLPLRFSPRIFFDKPDVVIHIHKDLHDSKDRRYFAF